MKPLDQSAGWSSDNSALTKRRISISKSAENLKPTDASLKKSLYLQKQTSDASKPPIDPKSRFRSLSKTVYHNSHRSSSSDESSSEDGLQTDNLKQRQPAIREVVFQLRRYNDAWFRTRVTMRITKEADAAAIDVEDALSRAQPRFIPQVGFELDRTLFIGHDKLLLTTGRYLCQLDVANCADELTFIDMSGRITSIGINENNDMLVVVVDYRRGATLFVKSIKNVNVTHKSFIVGLVATQLLITPDGKKVVLMEVDQAKTIVRLTAYTIEDGKIFAEVKYELEKKSSKFEISLCPADEDVVCLLTDESANLYRIIPGQLLIFSTVKADIFTCHAWADDVTLAFGSSEGKLLLYRESIALEAIDLGKMHGKLIADAQKSNKAGVIKMSSSDSGLVVCVEIGVIFIFPPRSDEESTNRWKNSRAIVIDSLHSKSYCSQLCLDPTGQNLFYVDSESLWYCNIQYIEAVCRDGMRLVLAQHAKKVKCISSDFGATKNVMTIDESGLVIVSSGVTKKLLATHLNDEIISGVMLKGGNKVLLLTSEKLQQYWILCRSLVKDAVVMKTKESHLFQAMSQNIQATKLALLTTDTLYILDMDTFRKTCYVIVGSKESVVALRWSADDSTIACLSNNDTVCLIDVIEGRLLWTIDFKLRFFVDLSCYKDTVYVMGNKFMMTRLQNGKELEATNVHQEGISLKANSTALLTTESVHFVASSGGNVNKVDIDNPDQTYLINCPNKDTVTTLYHDPAQDQLFVGFEDGRVVCFNVIAADDKDNDTTVYSNDYVLCAVSRLQQLETEIKNLKVQCNLIRAQSAGVLDEYKQMKEGEITDLKTELETTLLAMREKMKRAEEKYEAIEASKEEAFAKMKKEMDEQVESQKQYYEKLVNDQIKGSLEKDELNQQRIESVEEDFKEKLVEMKESFKKEEKQWNNLQNGLLQEIKQLKYDKHKLEKGVEVLMTKRSDERKIYEQNLAKMKQKAHDESKENVNQIKQLKAYLLREKEAREKSDSQTADVRTELANTQEELDKARDELEHVMKAMTEENQKTIESMKKLEERNKEFEVLKQKQRLLASELEKEKTLRHAHQRRLKHFEMLIDEMSEHIYDSRRLEQSVLGLLAFFNSVPKSGQMMSAEQLKGQGKNQTAKTRKVVQLGTSRHKAH
ncbi:unnamed protein product [Bursaphelenchus okinawaensis]|uniref:Uncharacterized protein n=1 Tax=Bursaphelenchus okinawaensis TaxID=465554 RepID=A0A811KB17_9BILA|nr:unnamed protein product [Bursaphelenchus okinawaensis]CAG9098409.1 unnamed protein product [Bursaphelenchus okinawaensis]